MQQTRIEILAVGNELLDGITQDTNTHWLCRELTARGCWVSRAAMVRDDRDAIAAELRGAGERGTALLLVTGGLGPTDDDMTLEAVAQGAGRPLVEHPQARRMVTSRYEALHRAGLLPDPSLRPERLKMAILPQGAEPIENPVGAAPAVRLQVGGMTAVCLPGVPGELKGIFAGPLQPVLDEILGAGALAEEEVVVKLNDESAMAGALREVAKAYPQVYVKSHARDFEFGPGIRVTLSARSPDPEAARAAVAGAAEEVRRRLPT